MPYLVAEHSPEAVTGQQQELVPSLPCIMRHIWVCNDTCSSEQQQQ
jgi:hypothetical protein